MRDVVNLRSIDKRDGFTFRYKNLLYVFAFLLVLCIFVLKFGERRGIIKSGMDTLYLQRENEVLRDSLSEVITKYDLEIASLRSKIEIFERRAVECELLISDIKMIIENAQSNYHSNSGTISDNSN